MWEFDKFFLCMHLGLERTTLYGVLHAPVSFFVCSGGRPDGLISVAQTRMVHLEAQVFLLTSGAEVMHLLWAARAASAVW